MAQSPLRVTLDRIPASHSRQITPYRTKYDSIRWERTDVLGSQVFVPQHSETPEGFVFEMPSSPYRPYERKVQRGGLRPVFPDAFKSIDVFAEAYEATEAKYGEGASVASSDFVSLGSEMEAIEAEIERYQQLLDEKLRAARQVLNAWAHLLVEEAGLKSTEIRKGSKWHSFNYSVQRDTALDEVSTQAQGGFSSFLSELGLIETQPDLSDSESELAGKVCRRLWIEIVGGRQRILANEMIKLSDHLSMPPGLTLSASAGMLFHVQSIAEHMRTLLHLDAKLVAAEVVRHTFVLGNPLPSTDVLRADVNEEELEERSSQRNEDMWNRRRYALADILFVRNEAEGRIDVRQSWESGFGPTSLFRSVYNHDNVKDLSGKNPENTISKYFQRQFKARYPGREDKYPGKDYRAWIELAREWAAELPLSWFDTE